MFHAGGNDVVALAQTTQQGNIQRFRTIFGEDDALVTIAAEKIV